MSNYTNSNINDSVTTPSIVLPDTLVNFKPTDILDIFHAQYDVPSMKYWANVSSLTSEDFVNRLVLEVPGVTVKGTSIFTADDTPEIRSIIDKCITGELLPMIPFTLSVPPGPDHGSVLPSPLSPHSSSPLPVISPVPVVHTISPVPVVPLISPSSEPSLSLPNYTSFYIYHDLDACPVMIGPSSSFTDSSQLKDVNMKMVYTRVLREALKAIGGTKYMKTYTLSVNSPAVVYTLVVKGSTMDANLPTKSCKASWESVGITPVEYDKDADSKMREIINHDINEFRSFATKPLFIILSGGGRSFYDSVERAQKMGYDCVCMYSIDNPVTDQTIHRFSSPQRIISNWNTILEDCRTEDFDSDEVVSLKLGPIVRPRQRSVTPAGQREPSVPRKRDPSVPKPPEPPVPKRVTTDRKVVPKTETKEEPTVGPNNGGGVESVPKQEPKPKKVTTGPVPATSVGSTTNNDQNIVNGGSSTGTTTMVNLHESSPTTALRKLLVLNTLKGLGVSIDQSIGLLKNIKEDYKALFHQ